MTNSSSLDLDLAALLSARLCHDLAGPVSAVNNGAELLAEVGAESMEDARELISNCTGRRSGACAFSASLTAAITARWIGLARWKPVLRCWPIQRSNLPSMALMTAPKRGRSPASENWRSIWCCWRPTRCREAGSSSLPPPGEVGAPRITIRGKGAMLVLDDISADAHASGCRRDGAVLKDLNARYVQPYLTGLLAAELGLVVRVEASGDGQFEVSSAPA